jgi:hypothetical protein
MFTSLSVIKDVGSIGGHVITNTHREEILDKSELDKAEKRDNRNILNKLKLRFFCIFCL